MALFLLHIIQSSICLTLFYLFFILVMRGSTLFRFNRMTLFIGTWVCMLLPFFPVTVSEEQLVQAPMQALSEMLTAEEMSEVPILADDSVLLQEGWARGNSIFRRNPTVLIGSIYLVGMIITLGMTGLSFIRMWQIIRSTPRKKEGDHWLIVTPQPVHSFSFGKFVVLNQEDYQRNSIVWLHEQMHLRYHHTLDSLWFTLMTVLHWFNPVVWLMRLEMQQLHEYEADDGVIKHGIDATQYQLLLVKKAVGTRLYSISMANGFHHSKLKKRITMMLKERTNGWERLKLLIVVPVAMGTMLVFARPEVKKTLEEAIPTVQQEEPSDLNALKAFFKEKEDAYLQTYQRTADGKGFKVKERQVITFRVNWKSQIMIDKGGAPFDGLTLATPDKIAALHTELGAYLRRLHQRHIQEAGQDEAIAIRFQHDASSNEDSLYSYLKTIKRVFEDLRKEYTNEAEREKYCPIWVSIEKPREYGKGKKRLKAEVTLMKEGIETKTLKSFTLNELDKALKDYLKDCSDMNTLSVNLKVDKDCPMQDVRDIKQMLREAYVLRLNYSRADEEKAQ